MSSLPFPPFYRVTITHKVILILMCSHMLEALIKKSPTGVNLLFYATSRHTCTRMTCMHATAAFLHMNENENDSFTCVSRCVYIANQLASLGVRMCTYVSSHRFFFSRLVFFFFCVFEWEVVKHDTHISQDCVNDWRLLGLIFLPLHCLTLLPELSHV